MSNFIEKQIEYWYGKSYHLVNKNDWKPLIIMIKNEDPFKTKDLLTLDCDTEDKVVSVYGNIASYRKHIHAKMICEWKELGADPNGLYPIFSVDGIGPNYFGITYNRIKDGYSMTWPLDYHIKEARNGFLDKIPFTDKISKIIFRGSLTSPITLMKISPFEKASRFEIVEKFISEYWVDFGLTSIPNNVKESDKYKTYSDRINKTMKNIVKLEDHFKYKYILCMEGVDVSTAFGWVLLSNCIPIHPYPYIHNIWFHQDLKPYVHFVPIKPDGSDLKEIFLWCESHQEECEKIVANGKEHMIKHLDENNLKLIKKGVVQKWSLNKNNFF